VPSDLDSKEGELPASLGREEPGKPWAGPSKLGWKERQKLHQKGHHNWDWASKQAKAGTDHKGIVDRHHVQSAQVSILTGFDPAACPDVTAPGWISKQLETLPQHTLGLQELLSTYPQLTVFPWDGR
jgi:hypothetical protein